MYQYFGQQSMFKSISYGKSFCICILPDSIINYKSATKSITSNSHSKCARSQIWYNIFIIFCLVNYSYFYILKINWFSIYVFFSRNGLCLTMGHVRARVCYSLFGQSPYIILICMYFYKVFLLLHPFCFLFRKMHRGAKPPSFFL